MAPMKRPVPVDKSIYGETFSLAKLAQRWRISEKGLRELLGQGHLAFEQIRGAIRVPRREVELYESCQHFESLNAGSERLP